MMLDGNSDGVDDVESVMFRRDLRRYRYREIRHCYQNFLPVEFDSKEELKKGTKRVRCMQINSTGDAEEAYTYVLRRKDIGID